jgi:hypothetical protein
VEPDEEQEQGEEDACLPLRGSDHSAYTKQTDGQVSATAWDQEGRREGEDGSGLGGREAVDGRQVEDRMEVEDGREVGGREGGALPALPDGYEWIKVTKKDGSFMDVILTKPETSKNWKNEEAEDPEGR